MDIVIIGVDCATVGDKVGIALVEIDHRQKRLVDVSLGGPASSPGDQIAKWLEGSSTALIALDAPLGWPLALSKHLTDHSAGSSVEYPPDMLFRRETDRYVERIVRKRPLEVGADRIARTAVAALSLLAELSQGLGRPIPLAWSHTELPPLSAIEVYPAATLRARSLVSEGYKRSKGIDLRRSLCAQILQELPTDLDSASLTADDNVFDAVLCAIAGIDFVEGRAIGPYDQATASKEGWIWFASPGA